MQQLLSFFLEELKGAWRFRKVAVAVSWGLCLIAFAVILMMPNVFQASARVFVDTRTALSEATRGLNVESSLETQIQRVRQAIVGGPQMMDVAAKTGLIKDSMPARQKELITNLLRESIEISGQLSRDSNSAGMYVISYTNHDRDTSIRVVDTLLKTFIEGTVSGKREGGEQAQAFLQSQITDYEGKLAAAESRLADFKKKNVGLMPGAQGDYFTRMQTEQDLLSKSQAALAVAVRKRDELDRQLRGTQPVLTGSNSSGASALPSMPVGANSDTATRIRETQSRLDELLLRFTDKHPDVIALKSTLVELEQRQNAEIAAAKRGDPGAAARTGLSANPVFQSIQLAYNQAEVDRAATEADIADHQRKIAELKTLVNTAPEVEAEYARLNRDYDVVHAQHKALLERLQRTRFTEDADATGVFRIETIEKPNASLNPIAPKRSRLFLVALVLSLGAGFGAAYLLHKLKPVFLNARQLNELSGLPVLGTVSMTWLPRYRQVHRSSIVLFAGAMSLLVVFAIVVILVQGRAVDFIQGFKA